MSKLKEFVDSWNEFLPENRISPDEVKNVQESVFRSWLITILSKLNVDTSGFDTMNHENGSRLRASRMKLLSTVNHFLVLNHSMTLNYMNLVSPDSKTVTQALRYLLNYVFFVNHFCKETISNCAQKVLERDQLKSKMNNLQKEIERNKIKEENNVKLIRDLDKSIPHQKSTIITLKEEEEWLKKEVKRLEEDIQTSEMKCAENRAQIASINENIVSEEEARNILFCKEKLLEQLKEQDDIMMANRLKLKENSTAIEVAQSLTSKMETLLSKYTIDSSELKNMKKKLENAKINLAQLKNNITRTNLETESLTQQIQLKKDNIEKLNQQKKEFENNVQKKDKSKIEILKKLTDELRSLIIKEDELVLKRDTIKKELNLLYIVSSNILKQMSENIYQD